LVEIISALLFEKPLHGLLISYYCDIIFPLK